MLNRIFSPKIITIIATISSIVVLVVCLMPVPQTIPGNMSDKIEHFFAYFCLGLFWIEVLKHRFLVWQIMLVVILGGAGIEGLQALTPHRSAEWLDFAANTSGVVAAFVFASLNLFKSKIPSQP